MLNPFESVSQDARQPVVRYTSGTSRAQVEQFVADIGATAEWSRLSGPAPGTNKFINGQRVELWELPIVKTPQPPAT